MRLLIVEDEHKIAGAIKQGLERQSYAVDVAYDGDQGLSMATTEPYDLIILDRMLPGKVDGLGILERLREQNNHVPVLLLTAKDKVLDRASGLNLGADDYLVKPFAFVELIARVRALLRRPANGLSTVLTYANLRLDPTSSVVERSGRSIELTSREFALLELFLQNPRRVLTRTFIAEKIWEASYDLETNLIDVYVRRLRQKLDQPKVEPFIRTVRGSGYQLT